MTNLLDKVHAQTHGNCEGAHQRHEQAIELSGQFMKAAETLPTLYRLGEEWNHLIWQLEQPDADAEKIEAELHRLAGDIRAKGYGLAVVLQGLDRLAERQRLEARQQQDEVSRLANKAKATEAHAQRLRDYALKCMDELGETRIETGTFTLSVRQNPPSVNVLDAAAVPSEYQRTKIEVTVDKKSIIEDFKRTGAIPPGCQISHGERLEVR